MNLVSHWLSSNGLMPHGFCYQWKPALIWLHAGSDTLIALAYFSIPVALIHLVRKKRDIPFSWMFVCFGVFIAACGATHLMEVWTLWVPSYWFSGGIKVITAVASIPTAISLVRLVPQALNLPNPEAMRAANEELLRQDVSLKKSEERFRQMAGNIQEIFWTMNPETKETTYVSPAFEQICELPVDALYSNPTSYRELIHPEDRQRVLTALEKLENSNRFEEEFRIVCPSGATKWLRAIGFNARDSGGVIQTIVGTVQEITARKEMEVVLRESEDRYRDLVEHSSDLICTHDLEGRLLSVNELPVKLLGYTREELLNKPMREFLLPEARAQFDQALLNIKKEGFVKGTMVVLTKTGERRIWEYHNTLRTDGVSAPIVRGVAHDVTDQRRIEKALRLSEEKFSKAFLASPYAIVISTIKEGRLIEVNDSFLRIMEFSREESIGHTSFDLGIWTGPSDRDEILVELANTGRVKSRQVAFLTKSGKQLEVNYSAEAIELGGHRCLLSVCEDITDRKRADERLREYEKAVEGVEEMIAVVDRSYRYLLANRAFIDFRGSTREKVVGRLVPEVVDKETFQRIIKNKLDECFEGKIVVYELKYTYPKIGERDLLISYFPVESSAGVDRAVCVLRDITDRKRSESELRQLSGQLLRLQDEERRKIARDLHDSTGQDLVALSTIFSQLSTSLPASGRKMRKLAFQGQSLAERCIREVRTLSYVLHPPMLDESGLEDALHHFVDGFAERTGIQVELEVSPRFGRLAPEMELGLFRVVQESLTNIQRHSGSFRAKIRLLRDAEKSTLEVSDEGRGISYSKNEHKNTIPLVAGVGIPSMEERAQQVGGRLEIESNGSGTTVRVMIPVHE